MMPDSSVTPDVAKRRATVAGYGCPPSQPPSPNTDGTCGNPACGKTLVKKRGESAGYFARRLHCDNTCRGAAYVARRQAARRICPICGEPYPPGKSGSFSHYCGAAACDAVIRSHRKSLNGWPKITGEIDFGGGFGRHNVNPKDGGFYKLPSPPDRHSSTGCAAAMMAEAGE